MCHVGFIPGLKGYYTMTDDPTESRGKYTSTGHHIRYDKDERHI